MIYLWYVIPAALFLSAVARESGVFAFCGLMALFGVTYAFYETDPLLWIWLHPVLAVAATVGYFLIGFLWSLFKYHDWLRGQEDAIAKAMERWRRSRDHNDDISLAAFSASIYADTWKPAKNKERILFWMTWWVFSSFWYITHDLFAKVWSWIYSLVAREFEWLADRAFRRSR